MTTSFTNGLGSKISFGLSKGPEAIILAESCGRGNSNF